MGGKFDFSKSQIPTESPSMPGRGITLIGALLTIICIATGSIRFRRLYFAPKKLPVNVSKQGRKQSPGSTKTFTSVK